MHHLPLLADTDPTAAAQAALLETDEASSWSRAILPLLESATVRLLLSGTLERADGRGILWLPYRKGPKASTREVQLDAPGWAVVGYSRRQALAEKAVLPVTFGALDGEARWREEDVEVGPHRLSGPFPQETTRPALFTALRTGFAEALLREAFLGHCHVDGVRGALDREAARHGRSHCHQDAGLLLPDLERLGAGTTVLSGRHQVAPWPEVAVDHGVRRQEALRLLR